MRRSEMSTKTKTTAWSDVRAKRPVDASAVSEHVARMEAEERAYRLREIREEQGVTQKELADRMAITQPTVSARECGDPDRSGPTTPKAYVGGPGGSIDVTANFGNQKVVLSTRP